MQKHVNLVDLVKSFPTNIFLQNLASIQKRTSPIKFAHSAEKSENGSISNLSTKFRTCMAQKLPSPSGVTNSMPSRSKRGLPSTQSLTWVERFGRRGTEPNELFRSEFGQNSFKIEEFSLENSKNSENFNIF